MENLYDILKVSINESESNIKNAYKSLALKYHPDKNKDPSANESFQKINNAYEILSDQDKRRNYDQSLGITLKNHHYYNCNVTLEEIYFGTIKKIKVSKKSLCKKCNENCNVCNGTGKHTQIFSIGPFEQRIEHMCVSCSGQCHVYTNDFNCKCEIGYDIELKIFEINIEKGINNGHQIIFKGWGEQANKSNEIPGNLIVIIKEEQHVNFKRINSDLHYTMIINLIESIVGKSISIPLFSGPLEVDTAGFGILNPNKQYIIFKKGITESGNLSIKFIIDYPEKTFTKQEKDLLKNTFGI